jgi:deoxyribodipyrimidine photo-lyase
MGAMTRSVVWFRRDLRVADHPALAAAAADGEVVPLFVIDPVLVCRSGAPRRAFLHDCLAALHAATDAALVVRVGDPAEVVPAVAAEAGAARVWCSKDFGGYGRRRDVTVAERLRADGRSLRGLGSPYAVDPGTVVRGDGGAYAVFTPFRRAWERTGWKQPLGMPEVRWARGIASDPMPPRPGPGCHLPPAGEGAAHAAWETFRVGALDRYDVDRDVPGRDGTSRLSAALRWGVLHPRQLLAGLDPSDPGPHATFRSELCWREFYADVLFRMPETAWRNLRSSMDAMPVDTDAAARSRFARWAAGTTGYPIVDAGMRQLTATGWMHNRVRMIVASFLVKDLHLPWQWGARHFMDHLVDGDTASNSHGWQWTAGTGTDAAPYFRVFNPVTQGERYDPDGAYVRRWVPELASFDGPVHAPWAGRRGSPPAYPSPMVDHAAERVEALRRYATLPRH